MNNTTKYSIAFVVVLIAFSGGILAGRKLEKHNTPAVAKVDLDKLGVCLAPYSGKVQVKDKDGKNEEVSVVVSSAIPACLK